MCFRRAQKLAVRFTSGARLAVSHGTLVVGAPAAAEGRGSVYIFERHGHKWLRRQQLIAINGEPGDNFGASVSIDRGLIAIGAPGAQSHGPDCVDVRGVAYVFAPHRGLWFEQQKVEAPDCEQFALDFGSNVAIRHGRLAIAIPASFPIQARATFIHEATAGALRQPLSRGATSSTPASRCRCPDRRWSWAGHSREAVTRADSRRSSSSAGVR